MQPPSEVELLDKLGSKYIWWASTGDEPHAPERIIAQVMNIGTYDDIRTLETTLGFSRLADVMLHAAPGWFSARSWSFWRGRLRLETDAQIPAAPPLRSFHAAGV
jgi:hypothetical protein